MGRLYDACQAVMRLIDDRGYDPFKTRGAIALETGFLISMVKPDDPDDPEKIEAIHRAAEKVLGVKLDF